MPELIEVELYRRVVDRAVGRTVAAVHAPDPWFCKGTTPAELAAALTGVTLEGTRRRGKLLLVDTDGPVLGLRVYFALTILAMAGGLLLWMRRSARSWSSQVVPSQTFGHSPVGNM